MTRSDMKTAAAVLGLLAAHTAVVIWQKEPLHGLDAPPEKR